MTSLVDVELDEHEWARDQTCQPLEHNDDVAIAKQFLTARGFPLHNDRWKNWDNFLAVHHARRLCADDDEVLDAGACRDPNSPSVFLQALHGSGFTNLVGCNLDEGAPVEENGVLYEFCDLEEMSYADGRFKFIACLSVIEHGVNTMKYFHEMARILQPGGYLFTSFDYWESPVDTKGQMAFGKPIRIFTEHDVMQMTLFAKSIGLGLMKRPELKCTRTVVEWMGMRYTFMNLLMKKGDE